MANTKQKSTGLHIDDLKKSLKTLTSEMNPEQLKRANETLEKLESSSKQDTVKNEEIQKTNLDIKKSLGKDGDVNKSLQDLLKYYKVSNDKLLKKLDEGNKAKAEQDKPKSRTNLSDIKYDKSITAKEYLKEGVAGAKGLFSKAQGVGSSVLNAFKNPMGALNNIGSGIKSKVSGVLKTGKDILSTQEGYTAEGGRFGEAYAKTDVGQKEILALKKEKGISLDEARDQIRRKGEGGYADLSKKEKEISGVKEKQKFLTSQGFDPNSKDVKKLSQLTDAKNQSDIRNATGPTAGPSSLATLARKEKDLEDQKSNYAPIQSNIPGFLKPLGNIGDKNTAGKNINDAALTPAAKANDAAEASAKESEKQFLAANPEGDNIKSAQEIMADASKEDLQISKQLLETTRESLLELKGIKEALSVSANSQKPEPKKKDGDAAAAAGAEVAPESGPGIGDAIDLADDLRGKGKPKGGFPRGKAPSIPGKSMGSRIMGGIKGIGSNVAQGAKGLFSGGGNLIKGALGGISAGGAVAAATTIGGGLALNYGLTKGADAITEAAGADTDYSPEMQAQDDANWEKASLFEKIQSAPARGIEKAADFLGAEKTAAAAKVSRTKSETEYLNNKEAEAKPSETVNGKKGANAAEGQADDQKLIDQFVKAYPPSKGFTYEGNLTYLTIFDKEGKKAYHQKIGKELKTMDPATFAGLAMKSGGQATAEAKPTETVAGEKSEKDLFGGLTKEQYQFAIQKVNGKYKNEMIDENGKEITDEKKRIEAMKKGVGQLQDLTDAAGGKKDVTAKMEDGQVGALQPAGAEGKLSSDPQMDQDIKANQKRVANVTPTKPSTKSGELSNSSLEYTDLDRERSQSKPSPAPVIMNNSSNNATTKVMPMKGDPRPNSRGSAFEKYEERTSTF
jgi:hypothetical protein